MKLRIGLLNSATESRSGVTSKPKESSPVGFTLPRIFNRLVWVARASFDPERISSAEVEEMEAREEANASWLALAASAGACSIASACRLDHGVRWHLTLRIETTQTGRFSPMFAEYPGTILSVSAARQHNSNHAHADGAGAGITGGVAYDVGEAVVTQTAGTGAVLVAHGAIGVDAQNTLRCASNRD
jgi:hypothetical protein